MQNILDNKNNQGPFELSSLENKLILSTINLLIPKIDKSFYLEIIINEEQSIKTKSIAFTQSAQMQINQSFLIKSKNISKFKILFKLYEESLLIPNYFCGGECSNENFIKDDTTGQLMCYLINQKYENTAVVYFNLEYSNIDIISLFDLNKVHQLESNNVKENFIFSNSNFNNDTLSLFITNLNYFKNVIIFLNSLIIWKNKWKTFSFLFIITFFVFNIKFMLLIMLPILIIFFHLTLKDNIENFVIANKNSKENKEQNIQIFYSILTNINYFIQKYENIIQNLFQKDGHFTEYLYKNLIKLVFFNFIVFYIGFLYFVSLKKIILFLIWFIFLKCNPKINSFFYFLINLISHMLVFLNINNNLNFIKIPFIYTFSILSSLVPFNEYLFFSFQNNKEINYNTQINRIISHSIEDNNQSTILKAIQLKNINLNNSKSILRNINSENVSNINKLIKIELYENERWWMVVGWNKNLILDEVPEWHKAENKKIFCDKSMIKLPNNDYKWIDDWKIEKNEKTDNDGWEYSSDFHSEFSNEKKGKYVRRRKWIRYAS